MTIEIVDFPINSLVIFHSYVNVYQRLNPLVFLVILPKFSTGILNLGRFRKMSTQPPPWPRPVAGLHGHAAAGWLGGWHRGEGDWM